MPEPPLATSDCRCGGVIAPSQSPAPTLVVRACILLFFSETSRRRSAGHQQGSRAVAWGGHCCDKVMRSCSQLAYFPCQSSPRRSVQSVGQLCVFLFTSVLVELQNSVFECSTIRIRESLTNETLCIRCYVLGVEIQNKDGHFIDQGYLTYIFLNLNCRFICQCHEIENW